MPVVSIIMPVYNALPYLKEAVDSILKQQFADFELICIDDGSTDGSYEVLEQLREKDNRISILHQSNQGAGVARNYGMSIAKGEYLLFLDADDIFLPNLLSDVVKCAKEKKSDITVYRFESYNSITKQNKSCDYAFRKEEWQSDVINWKDNPKKIFTSFNPCAWNKLFKKSFIDSIKLTFQNNKRTNDLYFTTIAMALAKRIALLDKVLLFYRIGNVNSSQATNNIAELDFFKALIGVKTTLEKNLILDELQSAFNELVTNTITHNIKTSKDSGIKIYDFLMREGFKKLNFNYKDNAALCALFSRYQLYEFKKRIKKAGETTADIIYSSKKINQDDIAVSVIIPVYNVEKYLIECLKSVSSQTLKNIEIIAVNDGSTDSSLEILSKYSKKEDRLIVLNQANAGLSMARNNGTNIAKGEYIYFLDSDDFIDMCCLEKLYNKSKIDNLDILFFDAESFFDFKDEQLENKFSNYKNYYKRKGNYQQTMTGKELLRSMYKNDEYRVSAALQFIKRSFWIENRLDFYPGLLYEDNLFTFTELLQARRVEHINEAFYKRRIRKNSIVTRPKNFCDAYSYYICWREMLKIKSQNYHTSCEELDNIIESIRKSYIRIFNNLTVSEKDNILFLTPAEQIDWISKNAKNNTQKNNNMQNNSTINRTIRYYNEHGLLTTVKKVVNKIIDVLWKR